MRNVATTKTEENSKVCLGTQGTAGLNELHFAWVLDVSKS